MLNILTLDDPSFWERRVKGLQSPPSLSSWICTEESGCPAWPSWCCWQDPHAACPSHWYWQLSSWTRYPSMGFCSARTFLGIFPRFSWFPVSPPLGGATGYSPEGGYRESLNSLTSLGSESNAPYWPPTPQPVLFTWDRIDGTAAATLQWPPRGKPVSLLTVPSCELHFWKIIALYCSNQYAQYMLNVYEYTFLFLSFENVRSIFCFLVYVELKKDLKKLSRPKLH